MTHEEIIDMAKQSGCIPRRHPECWEDVQVFATPDVLITFAKLVADKERERFIQICNHQADIETDYLDKNLLWQLRDAVKARGQA